MNWIVYAKNDRLKRYSILNAGDPGRGKEQMADNIRRHSNAYLMAAAPNMQLAIKNALYRLKSGQEVDEKELQSAFNKSKGA